MMNYSYDNYGWLSSTHDSARCTDVVPPTETATKKANWTGVNWVLADYVAPPIPVAPAPSPTEFLIDPDSFRDRFAPFKREVLTSADPDIMAFMADMSGRPWIDLKNPELPPALAYIGSVIPEITAAMQASILSDPVTPRDNLVLRKLYF